MINARINIKGTVNAGTVKVYPELEDIEITPTTEEQNLKSNKYGYNEIKVNAVTSEIDSNITPKNIKEGVDILGVTGTMGSGLILEGLDSTSSLFNGKRTLTSINNISGADVTNANGMFGNCSYLVSVGDINFPNCTNYASLFSYSNRIVTIGAINCASCTSKFNYSDFPDVLENLGGFIDYGKALNSSSSANTCSIQLNKPQNLTEQSIINVLNGLYDIKNLGVTTTQTVNFGPTNLSRLTSQEGQEALANARAKGWTIT